MPIAICEILERNYGGEDADAWRLLQMTENGDTEQVGGSIVFE